MRIMNLVSAKVWGGGEQYVYDMSVELTKRDIFNLIVVDKKSVYVKERFASIANVESVNLHFLNGSSAIRKLIHIIKKYKIDIINCHSGKMSLLCVILKKICNVKIVFFKHNALPSKFDAYHRYLRKSFDTFVCVSDLVYRLQTQGLSAEEAQKFVRIHNGINPERFPKIDNFLPKDDNVFTIGYAGRIAEGKGLDILIEAFSLFAAEVLPKKIRLRLAGMEDKGYKEVLETDIQKQRLKNFIQFDGTITDMNIFYRSIDVLVLPSTVREAFGLVLCEAMYCNTLVITSNSGAQREIIPSSEYGFVIDFLTAQSLCNILKRIYYCDQINKGVIQKKAHERVVKYFTVQKMVSNLIDTYTLLL